MAWRSRLLLAAVLLAPLAVQAADSAPPKQIPVTMPTKQDPRLELFATSDRDINSISTTLDGRVFVSMPQVEGPGPQVAEYKGGKFVPYPNLEWSLWKPGGDVQNHLVHVNSARIGPDGDLWVIDAGGLKVGGKAVPGAAKIVRISTKTNKIARIYHADPAAVHEYSYFNDMRFNGAHAYISDSGAVSPGVVVLDLATGKMRRVLDDHPLTVASHDMYGDGGRIIVLKDPIPDDHGKTHPYKLVNIDQLEVSPDGKWLYFQPIGGPLARVPTALLDDPTVPKAKLDAAVEKVMDTWTGAGTAIDAAGNIYMSRVTDRTVMKITPDRKASVLITDPRLTWIDAMWVSKDGYLYMPAAQLDRTVGNQGGGPSKVEYPIHLYRMKIDQKPSPIDHR